MREISNKPSPQLVTLILGMGVLAVSSCAILVRIAIASSGEKGFGFSL